MNSQPAADEAPSPRWTAIFALVSVALINLALPASLSVGPNWLLSVTVAILTIPTIVTHRAGQHNWNQILGYMITGLETAALVSSVALLVAGLPSGKERAVELLRAGALLWISNVLTFALWYWRLDAGGPHQRESRPGHRKGDFLFPQMTLDEEDANYDASWSPQFVDYLFLAFNTSTAFSPTDAPVLSRVGKVLMMAQSLIALIVLAVLVSRAVNVL
jgi:hypothetical protein